MFSMAPKIMTTITTRAIPLQPNIYLQRNVPIEYLESRRLRVRVSCNERIVSRESNMSNLYLRISMYGTRIIFLSRQDNTLNNGAKAHAKTYFAYCVLSYVRFAAVLIFFGKSDCSDSFFRTIRCGRECSV